MSRAVICVATGSYFRGAARMRRAMEQRGENVLVWDAMPPGSPSHQQVPYAFKARALEIAAKSYDRLLWADACIFPVAPLDRIWERAAKDGAWIGRNGWTNAQWTADSAYPDLFPEFERHDQGGSFYDFTAAKECNRRIPHVVATAFAVDLRHQAGCRLLDRYCRLGLSTPAFKGPWINDDVHDESGQRGPCGDAQVLGHRHDQTALSVLAWRFGIPLTDSPDYFAYGQAPGPHDPRTILVADGAY